MEVSAKLLKGTQFEITARDHRVICDQPRDNGGEDAGLSPPELLLASIAGCAGYYAAQYLQTRGLRSDHLGIRVTAEKATQPARVGQFRIDVSIPDLDAQHEAGVLRAVKACLIHNTLLHAPSIETVVHTTAGALAR